MRRRRRSSGMVPYQPGLSHHDYYNGTQEQAIMPEIIEPGTAFGSTPRSSYGNGYNGYAQSTYQPTSWHGRQQCRPLYAVDPSAPYAIFTALRAIASSIRRRGPFALAELAVAGYLILAGSAFALNMVAGRPMRLTNVPIFDPTATGANMAWFVRPVVGTAADMGLDAQVDMFSSEDAQVKRDGLGQSRYAVQWENTD